MPLDSCPECVTEAFDRAIDRCVDVRPGHAYPDGFRRRESNRHGARDRLTHPTVISSTKHDPNTAELLSVTRQCRKHPVLGVRARLRAHKFIVSDDENAIHPKGASQG